MSSLLQCVDSRAYVLVHIVGPLAATVAMKIYNNVLHTYPHMAQSLKLSSNMSKNFF